MTHKILQSLKLTLLNVGHVQLDATWDYDNVISPFSRIYLITEGSAKVYHNDQVFHLTPGNLYLVPSYTYSRYTCEEYHEQYYISCLEEVGNGLSIYNLRHFTYQVTASDRDIGYFRRLLELNPDRALQNDDPKVYDNRPSLLNFEKKNERLSASAYIETQALLQLLLSRFIKSSAISQIDTGSELSDVISFIGEHLHEELTVARLAEFCHLSPDHFSRVFRKKFGLRPSVYLQSKRVDRAQLLLLTTNDSLAEIAAKTGWGNLSYFSRIFKKKTGKTPGTFRKERLEV